MCLLQSSPKLPNLLCRRAPWFCYRANQLQRSRGATILRIESRHRDKKASRSAYQSYLQRTRRNLEHQRWPATNTPLPEKTSVFGNEGLARGLRPQVPSRLGKPGLRPVSNERQPAEGLSLPQLGLGASAWGPGPGPLGRAAGMRAQAYKPNGAETSINGYRFRHNVSAEHRQRPHSKCVVASGSATEHTTNQ